MEHSLCFKVGELNSKFNLMYHLNFSFNGRVYRKTKVRVSYFISDSLLREEVFEVPTVMIWFCSSIVSMNTTSCRLNVARLYDVFYIKAFENLLCWLCCPKRATKEILVKLKF